MMIALTLLVFIGVAMSPSSVLGQNPYIQAYDEPRVYFAEAAASEATVCAEPGVKTNVDPAYPSGSVTYTSSTACLKSYEKLARTPSGAVHCNIRDARVKTTARANETLYPALTTKGTGVVEQCVSEGEYQHPDANAVLVAQCVVSFIVILICAALVLIRTWQHVSLFVRIWFICTTVVCILLLPSFYYLNALIGMGASMLAVVLFSTRDANASAVGITACITAVMWFTFDSGLGFLTHTAHLRLAQAGDPTISLYENLCDSYYRFSYHLPLAILGDTTNPVQPTEGVCLRGWLATETFFSVFLIISLIVLAVAGAHSLKHSNIVTNPITEEPTKTSSA